MNLRRLNWTPMSIDGEIVRFQVRAFLCKECLEALDWMTSVQYTSKGPEVAEKCCACGGVLPRSAHSKYRYGNEVLIWVSVR